MKRITTIVLAAIMIFLLAAGCANNNKPGASPSGAQSVSPIVTVNSPTANPTMPASKVLTGLGTDISIKSSKSVSTDTSGNKADALAQADVVMAAVAIDEGGKVLNVKFDTAQVKINFDDKGNLVTDTSVVQLTKKELGDQYNMKSASGIGKEWYEQIAALENWMKGKTADEVMAMKTKEGAAGHPAVPDEADLTSSVTISVDVFLNAFDKAAKSAKDFGATPTGLTTTGLGCVIDVSKSKSVAVENGKSTDALGEADVMMVAVTLDSTGKIVAAVIDEAQPKVNFNAQGAVTTDLSTLQKSKVELGDQYGMKSASGIGKEWYEQAAAMQAWMLGKTVDEVKAMKTTAGGDHPGVPQEADLTSSVTISVTSIIEALGKAAQNAS
jgi:NifU-like protein involved in Fe-S cluster formation